MNLNEIRSEIDAIDGELVKLFVQRMEASEKVAAAKRGSVSAGGPSGTTRGGIS